MSNVNLKALKTVELLGETVEIVVTGAMTGKHGSMVIETSPPGGGPPPHFHRKEDETLIVLEGEFEVLFNEQWRQMRAGEVAFLPRGSVHTFQNAGSETGKVALSFYPSGFEEFFGELAQGLDDCTVGERIVQAGARYGVTFLPAYAIGQ
jgi:quercetin dioxygenase-like cupin family protein